MRADDAPWAVILHGVTAAEPSPDEADTLIQAAEIGAALGTLGYRVQVRRVGLDLRRLAALRPRPPAVIVNLVESLDGGGRLVHLVPAALDALGLAYTGCSAEALHLTSNKPLAKRLMRQAGIPTPDWWCGGSEASPAARYIVKSVWEHASIGLDDGSVVPVERVEARIAERRACLGGEWFAERYVEGREFNISLLEAESGPQVLPIAEMTFVDFAPGAPRIVGYAAKWDASDPSYHNTVRRFDFPAEDRPLLARLEAVARDCWRCFGLAGYVRVDLRVDAEGQPFVLEINANPCLSGDAGFMAAARRAGLEQREVVARLIAAPGAQHTAIAAAAAE